ncbi:MAG: peptidoglycan-binding protein [Phycisphaerae bacterium]
MAATKIRIKLFGVEAMDGVVFPSPEDWSFEMTIKRASDNSTKTPGDQTATFEFKKDNTYNDVGWDQFYELTGADTTFDITIKGKSSLASRQDLGMVKVTIRCPILHPYNLSMPSSKNLFVAGVGVFITSQTDSWSSGITTIVQNSESQTYNTILDQMQAMAVHICPVIPVPFATGIPPLPRGVQHLASWVPDGDMTVKPGTTALNALVNPAVIPVLDPTDADFANQVARIHVTQIWPKDLDTDQFIWRAATSNVKFWSGGAEMSEVKGGVEVRAYGKLSGDADEMGEVTLHWNGEGTPKLATFRAWVGKPKFVWTRANIFKGSPPTAGPAGPDPTVTADKIAAQLDLNNVILWQVGIRMVMDKDETPYGNTEFLQRGVFRVTVPSKFIVNAVNSANMLAPLVNARPGVFNVAYIYTVAGMPTLNGMATDRLMSDPEGTADLDGSPSTSWIRPTGVFPDDDGAKVTMKQMGPSTARTIKAAGWYADGAFEKLCACIMTEQGANFQGSLTLAHELGHVLGLHHRGSGGGEQVSSYDGVNHLSGPLKGRGHPWNENLLSYGPNTRRQDLDILQAKVMRTSKLLRSDAPPPAPKPVPAANLPTENDKKLLQSYLCGKLKGLKHGPYDIGATGPNGDGVDGVIGPKTKAAIKQFQTDHGGLAVDGIYGPKTRAAFDNELNGK